MAQPAAKPKRVKTKEELAKIAKGNIPEFDFFTEDGNAVTLYLHNRNGRVFIPGPLHEEFFDACQAHTEALKGAGVDSLDLPLLIELEAMTDDQPKADDQVAEDEEPTLYMTAAEKRLQLFAARQPEIMAEIQRLSAITTIGFRSYAKLQSSKIDREFYYKALRIILAVDDDALDEITMPNGEPIPEEYRAEIQSDWDSKYYQDQNFEEVKTIVETFRGRVGF